MNALIALNWINIRKMFLYIYNKPCVALLAMCTLHTIIILCITIGCYRNSNFISCLKIGSLLNQIKHKLVSIYLSTLSKVESSSSASTLVSWSASPVKGQQLQTSDPHSGSGISPALILFWLLLLQLLQVNLSSLSWQWMTHSSNVQYFIIHPGFAALNVFIHSGVPGLNIPNPNKA